MVGFSKELIFIAFLQGVFSIAYYCDTGWHLHKDRCYRKFKEAVNGYSSRAKCQNYGGTLATVKDQDVQTFLQNNVTADGIGFIAYMGGTDAGHEGTWVWQDSEEPFTYTNWRPGEPNNQQGEHCMGGSLSTVVWNDVSCDLVLHEYICMKGAHRNHSIPSHGACSKSDCAIGSIAEQRKCTKTDILFMIDDSNSMFSTGFTSAKTMASDLVDCFAERFDDIRVALLTFGATTSIQFNFGDYKDKNTIKSAINAAPYRNEMKSYTGIALKRAENIMSSNPSDRLDIVIVLTDGESHDSVVTPSTALHTAGVFVFSVGIGEYFHTSNLQTIARNPNADYHVISNNYCDLHSKVSKLINSLCIGHSVPDFITCEMEIKDNFGEKAQSPTNGSSHCTNQQDFYGKYQPESIHTHVVIDGQHVGVRPTASYTDFHFGVQTARVDMVKREQSGTDEHIEGSFIKNSADYQHLVSTDVNMTNVVKFHNSERLCLIFKADVGGYITFEGRSFIYSATMANRTLCYFYDDVPPRHCSDDGNCTHAPIRLSADIINTTSLNVNFEGWEDVDSSNKISKFASGISHFEVYLHQMDYSNGILKMKHSSEIPKTVCNSCKTFRIDIPQTNNPMLYGIVLEVVDVALNSRQGRRFVLYDATSKLKIHEKNLLKVTSAYEKTHFVWQINYNDVCYDWKNRYYNNKFVHYNPLSPIHPGIHNHFTGVYEQTSGTFPVSGSTNVDGIISFRYSIQRDSVFLAKNLTVPNFPEEKMCTTISGISDGNTIVFNITAIDITGHKLEDGVVLYVDASPPEINDPWLIRDGTENIYVHNMKDLSTMVLKFKAFDVHSGLFSVHWSMKNEDDQIEFGHGALGVYSVSECTHDDNCYCPLVGDCQFLNYTLSMNSLVANNSHMGKHHRRYVIEIEVTNQAALRTTDSVTILVDESAPETGVVREGIPGTTDIDYTASPNITVNWEGFIDHESGIKFYRLGLSNSCLSLNTLWHPSGLNVVYYDTVQLSMKLTLKSEEKMYSSIIAFNNAMEPSNVVCSDGILLDKTPPHISNITVQNLMVSPAVGCTNETFWFLTENLTRIEIQCNKTCMNSQTQTLLHALPMAPSNSIVPDDVCSQDPFMNEYLYLGNDFLDISWNIFDEESKIEDVFVGIGSSLSTISSPDISGYTKTHHNSFYRLKHSGILSNTVINIFVKALNKANLEYVIAIGPIIIDETPPSCLNRPTIEITERSIRVSWDSNDFIDNEQTEIRKIYYRIVSEGSTWVTNFQKWNNRSLCYDNRYCITFPLSELQYHGGGSNRKYQFEFHVYNTAGHYCTILSRDFRLPSSLPPTRVKINDIDPSSIVNDKELEDADISFTLNTYCLHWKDVIHDEPLTYEVGVGTNKLSDDVVAIHAMNKTPTDGGWFICDHTTKLKKYQKYYVILKVSNSAGNISMSTNGFTIIDRNEFNQLMNISDGPGCSFSGLLSKQNVNVTIQKNTSLALGIPIPLSIGSVYTIFINISHTSYVVKSDNALFLSTNAKSFSFIAQDHHPILRFSTDGTENFELHSLETFQCGEDVDVQDVSAEKGANWNIDSRLEKLVSHYQISLLSCGNIVNSSCDTTIFKTFAKGKSYTFKEIYDSLQEGFYKVLLSACFGNKCFTGPTSDGFYLESFGPVLGSLSADLRLKNENCPELELHIPTMQCSYPSDRLPTFYRWAIFGDFDEHVQITGYVHNNNSTKEVKSCITVPNYPHKKMHVCIEGYCRSGGNSKRCTPITVHQHPNSFTKRVIYDLDAKSDFFKEIEVYRYATNIGDTLNALHSNEMDFISNLTLLGGFMIGIGNVEILWTVMKRAHISLRCDEDPDCVFSKTGRGGLVTFSLKPPLEKDVIYFLCANNTADSTMNQCSNGFIIDSDPPTKGEVKVHSSRKGFISDDTRIGLYWQGFYGGDSYKKMGYPSSIKSYEIAVGTAKEMEDVMRFRDVHLSSSIFLTNLSLVGGTSYYFSVKAYDHADNYVIGSSEPYHFDRTPPIKGMAYVGYYLKLYSYIKSHQVIVHCTGFEDHESGVEKFEIGIGSSKEADDVIPISEFYGTRAEISKEEALLEGHVYYAFVRVWNHAGLLTTTSSLPFVVDSSSPEAGIVRDGPVANNTDEDYTTSSTVSVHWTEFTDKHSPLEFYRIGLGTEPGRTDVVSLMYVGKRTEWEWKISLVPGVKYFTTVEGCNAAGLCSQSSSNGIVIDHTNPVPGYVSIGPENLKYVSQRSSLSVEWGNFADTQSEILQYEVCVGTTRTTCDVTGWRNYRMEMSALLLNLSLPNNVDLFAIVKATKRAGLSTLHPSHSFTVDDTPPIIGLSPRFIYSENSSAIYDSSVLRLKWSFIDNESPIKSSILSIKPHSGGRTEIDNILVEGNETFIKSLSVNDWLKDGDSYYAVITACNMAGLCTSSKSDTVLFDGTPPSHGHVLDNGAWSRANSTIVIKWKGYSDPEFGIKSYFVTVGDTHSDSDVSNGTFQLPHAGDDNSLQEGVFKVSRPLVNGDKLTFSIWAMNNANLNGTVRRLRFVVVAKGQNNTDGGLLLERHSCDVSYCTNECACAVLGGKCLDAVNSEKCNRQNVTNLEKNSKISLSITGSHSKQWTVSTRCLGVNWYSENLNVSRYEWSMGLKNMPYGFGIFNTKTEQVWHDVSLQTRVIHCLKPGKQLTHDLEYVAYLKTWLSGSDYILTESEPIVIDTSPPKIRRGKFITDSDNDCSRDQDFTDTKNILTCWNGVFSDSQSGIKEYKFMVGVTPGGYEVSGIQNVGLVHMFYWNFTNLEPGVKYYASVEAVNYVGLSTVLTSDGISIDSSPPNSGIVFNTKYFHNTRWHPQVSTFSASWEGFTDFESSIDRYIVSLIYSDGTLIRQEEVGIANKHTFHDVSLVHGESYMILVRAVDAAGHTSNSSKSPQVTVDATKPQGLKCTKYSLQLNTTVKMSTKLKENISGFSFKSNTLYKMYLLGDIDGNVHTVEVNIGGDLYDLPLNEHVSELLFMPRTDSNDDIKITIYSLRTYNVIIQFLLEECTNTVQNDADAIVVRQISPSTLTISLNVFDTESEIKDLNIYLGTNFQERQIKSVKTMLPFTSHAVSLSIPHGTKVYPSAMAANKAGLTQYLYSNPIIWDHTPPNVLIKNISVEYIDVAGRIQSLINLHWDIEEKESNIKYCQCAYGDDRSLQNIQEWKKSSDTVSFRSSPLDIPHGTRVFSSVECFNNVGLRSEVNWKTPIMISFDAPRTSSTNIDFAVYSTKVQNSMNIQRIPTSLHFHWPAFEDYSGITKYSVCIKSDNFIIYEWRDIGKHTYFSVDELSLIVKRNYTVHVFGTNAGKIDSLTINGSISIVDYVPIQTGNSCIITLENTTSLLISWDEVFELNPTMEPHFVINIGSNSGYADLLYNMKTSRKKYVLNSEARSLYVVITAKYITGSETTYRELLTVNG